jgi:hypothetical protein
MYYYLISQGIGFIGLGFITYAFQKKDRVSILRIQTIGSLLFSLHFWMMGALIGALLAGSVALRNQVFMRKHTHWWAAHPLWPYAFCVLSIAILATAWEGIISILPVTGMIVASYAMWLDDANKLKKYILISTVLWMPYSISAHAYPSLINQVFVCISAISSLKKDKKKRKKHHTPPSV